MTERPEVRFTPDEELFAISSAHLYKTRVEFEGKGRRREIPLVTKKFENEEVAIAAVNTYRRLKRWG